jgi:alkylation response protein AidB-like acyl-CoA dehydrogenase
MPSCIGGPPQDPATVISVIEEVSRADGSAGWTTMIGNTTAFVAWLQPAVAEGMLAGRLDFTAAGTFAPMGQAVPNGDGSFTVRGRWSFTSGAPHAEWLMNGVVVMDGDGPRVLEGGRPDWRFAWIPASEVTVLDNWRAAGLRGTGSHDTVVEGARVPEARTSMPFWEPATAPDPLFRLPFFTLLMVAMVGFPLGVARRALDELAELAARKSRRMDGAALRDDETVQVEVARLEGDLAAARAYVFASADDVWQTVQAGGSVDLRQRAHVASAAQHAVRTGLTVVDTAFRLAGGSVLYETHPLQRCLRDLHAGAQHLAFSLGPQRAVGRALLGLEPNTVMF